VKESEDAALMARFTYRFEIDIEGEWFCPAGMEDTQLSFLRGYALGRSDTPAPRRAMRIVRSDGKLMEQWAAATEVNIGLIAGWPTAGQYENAAERALETAKRIREAKQRREERRR
jgi:hypothetical protein